MRCSLRIKRSAAKAFASLPKVDRERLVEAIDLLCETPAAGSALKGEFEGLRLLRVGRYRVVYEWQRSDLVILVVRIGHRLESGGCWLGGRCSISGPHARSRKTACSGSCPNPPIRTIGPWSRWRSGSRKPATMPVTSSGLSTGWLSMGTPQRRW